MNKRLELTLLSKTELPVEVGVKGSVVSKEVLSIDHPKHGCNVATGTYKDLLSAGAIDPTKGCEMLLTVCFSHS
ncbi:unnamed protein product [Brassica oleracea var. botrytis]